MSHREDPSSRRGGSSPLASAPITVNTDVTEVVGLGEDLHTTASVFLPDPGALARPPVVTFGYPGAGYGRGYFSFEMPDSTDGGQARYHASRHGWIFVACDHLGVGESSLPDPSTLTLEKVAAGNGATVRHVTSLLRAGSLSDRFPPIEDPVRIGLGQSMGGCLTIVLQGTDPCFDAVAILGFSAIHTTMPLRDGHALPLDPETQEVDPSALRDALRWAFFSTDVPPAIVDADLARSHADLGLRLPWASRSTPGCVELMQVPAVVAREAAAIEVPVFVGAGEVDGVPNPSAERNAYRHSPDVTVCVVPDMAHMHNFAGTRTQLWDRLAAWGNAVRLVARDGSSDVPDRT